jgi:hypothetical protein
MLFYILNFIEIKISMKQIINAQNEGEIAKFRFKECLTMHS